MLSVSQGRQHSASTSEQCVQAPRRGCVGVETVLAGLKRHANSIAVSLTSVPWAHACGDATRRPRGQSSGSVCRLHDRTAATRRLHLRCACTRHPNSSMGLGIKLGGCPPLILVRFHDDIYFGPRLRHCVDNTRRVSSGTAHGLRRRHAEFTFRKSRH